MAKKENSGLKAGFTKDENVSRKAEARREAEEKALLEHARKQAEEAQPEVKAEEEAEEAEEAGPTITMQGVSGKKITSTVKVVRARKPAGDQAEDASKSEDIAVSPAAEERSESAKEDAAIKVSSASGGEDTDAEQKAQPDIKEVKTEVLAKDDQVSDQKTSEDTKEKAPEAKRPVKTKDERLTKDTLDKEKKEESTDAIATPNITPTLPSTTPGPRKIKSGSAVKAEQSAAVEESKKTQANRPAPRKEREAGQDKRGQSREARGDRKPRGERPQGQRPAADDRQSRSSQPGPNAPNRGQGPTREARPVGTLGRQVTPGKVGNIFDKASTKSDKVDSSLAATAKAFAQRKERQAQSAEERSGRRGGPGGRGQGGPRGQRGQGGYRSPGEGFGDKDKDDDQKPQFRRKQVKKTSTDEFAPVANTRPGFNQRDSKDRRNKDRDRDRGRRETQDRGLAELRNTRRSRRSAQQTPRQPVAKLTHVVLPEALTVKELAEALKKTAADVIKTLMGMGVLATMNQVVDYETASLIANEYEIETDLLIEETEEDILFDDSEDEDENLLPRPPVVAVMGHVDHGKTSLLDYIRSAHVTTGEAGGITQHIGAYQVQLNERRITFLDTPGHEAFTTMRARGAQATDIAILVVAADDGVMPQTIEAINHARAAETEIIVAINKIDKPGTNVDRVKQELSTHNLIPEEWGGQTIMVPVSAHTGEGIDTLLEMVLLSADILELKANPNRQAKGIVIEAKLDKNRGSLATMLVQRGTLKVGDTIVTGSIVGNIRAMVDSNQQQLKEAGPSVPVEIMGLPEVPEAGELFYVVKDERVARQLADKRRDKQREDQMSPSSRMSLDNLFSKMAAGEVQELNLIIKADVQGSVEAVRQSLEKLSNDEVKVNIVHGGVGAINETDLRLAEVSDAIIIGFNVRPPVVVTEQAKSIGVDIRTYSVIYHAIEDVESAMKGMLAPEYEEVVLGHIEVRETFKVSAIGTIGGGYVTDGRVTRNAQIRLLRDGILIHTGELASLRRFKDDVREVATGYECGFSLERYNDIKVGDVLEAFEMQEVERK